VEEHERWIHLIIGSVDYAFSAFTRDKKEPPLVDLSSHNFLERIGGLFTPRLSSSFQKALRTTLRFQTNFGQLNMSHERVDPEYRTKKTTTPAELLYHCKEPGRPMIAFHYFLVFPIIEPPKS
jgi:hypothetical protein